jgi:hypothetical protein
LQIYADLIRNYVPFVGDGRIAPKFWKFRPSNPLSHEGRG